MVIIDITAGNRHIYGGRLPSDLSIEEEIIFIDIEYDLKVPPTIFADNTKLPIRDEVISTHIYDPPYWFFGSSKWHGDPKEASGSFWGNFRNLGNLNRLLRGASKEIKRTLKIGGDVFVKWCDGAIAWDNTVGKCKPWAFFYWSFREVSREEWESKSGRTKHVTRWIRFTRVA